MDIELEADPRHSSLYGMFLAFAHALTVQGKPFRASPAPDQTKGTTYQPPPELIVYFAEATVLGAHPGAIAIALTVVVAEIVSSEEYTADFVVGVDPSSV